VVGGNFIEGCLCSFLSREKRKSIRRREKMKYEFVHETNDTGKTEECMLYSREYRGYNELLVI